MVDVDKLKCDVCGKVFNSNKKLEQHALDTHNTLSSKNVTSNRIKKSLTSNKLKVIIGVGVIVAVIIIGIGLYLGTTPKVSSLMIDGIQCNPSEQLLFHVHAHLDIIINGQYFLVPAQIGITNACYYWLHTHDVTGVIHIESPVNRDFTLGQFFDIWNKSFNNGQIKFNNGQIFNYVASQSHPLSVYVNGTKVPSGTNYGDIKLHAHDEITIVYGTPPSSIPSDYSFPQGL